MSENFLVLARELEEAMKEHEQATDLEDEANKAMCAARNRLNAAQKALDKAMEDVRNVAPWNTD